MHNIYRPLGRAFQMAPCGHSCGQTSCSLPLICFLGVPLWSSSLFYCGTILLLFPYAVTVCVSVGRPSVPLSRTLPVTCYCVAHLYCKAGKVPAFSFYREKKERYFDPFNCVPDALNHVHYLLSGV